MRDERNRARVGGEVGKAFSDQIRQRAPVRGDKWHMDGVGHLDCWRAVLAVARRRSKWLRSRRLGPASKRQSRCAAAHEEALEIRRHTAARHDHGQAPFMRRCEGARWAFASNITRHKGLNNRTENNRAENSHQPTRRRELIMKRFNRPGRHNGFCRFTIKSRTSSTSLIPNPSLPTSAVRRASEPLRLGARSPRRALRPSSSLRKIASSARRSPNLTVPIKDLPTLSGMVRHSRTTQL